MSINLSKKTYSYQLLSIIIFTIHLIIHQVFAARIDLKDDWLIQSSAVVSQAGSTISTDSFQPLNWYPVSVPSTVLAGLVANGVYKDPFYGMNLSLIDSTQFNVSWWYRTIFTIPTSEAGKRIWLNFSGINYRANIWLNGEKIADSTEVVGTYRTYEFDVTDKVNVDSDTNVIALEIFRPERYDLTINFVDWAPHPPDRNMGIFKEAYIRTSGYVKLRHTYVSAELDLPSLSTAKLTVYIDVTNAADSSVEGDIQGSIGSITFSKKVSLSAHETKTVTFSYNDFSQLNINNPSVWWPWQMGDQPLYDLNLNISINDILSDSVQTTFGIRQISSKLFDNKYRLFSVNGKDILIRGVGWCPDLFQRRTQKRLEAEIMYVLDMNLNTIRLEGKLEDREFYDLCDRYGILVMAGWCCSPFGGGWEKWQLWDDEDYQVAYASLRSQIYRHRNHPCMLVWLNGSDKVPPNDVEQTYLDILDSLSWPNPILPSATHLPSLTGPSGVKMTGPYKWVPPEYWLTDTNKGGAFGFNTETSPGAAVPPLESLQKMIPQDHLWPIDDYWDYHCGKGSFINVTTFTNSLYARYGNAASVSEYTVKAQVAAYESHRAMFEAYARNKYVSTGIIQWMLNNAWPSLIWHLYDYYLCPGGSYFGAKIACEPLHIMYSYDDKSIVAVNSYNQSFTNLKAQAYVYNLDATLKYQNEATVTLEPDGIEKLFFLPEIDSLTTTYFLRLTLEKAGGEQISTNSYWLSTIEDVLDHKKTTWIYTPTSSYADFTALQRLEEVTLQDTSILKHGIDEDTIIVTLTNPSTAIAFSVHLKIVKDIDQKEVLPILWEDNYFMLLQGENREITARYKVSDLEGATPMLKVEGWNIKNSVENIVPIKNTSPLLSQSIPHKYTITIYNLLGRTLFEYSSTTNAQQAVTAFRNKNLHYWKNKIAAGVYIVKMKTYYKKVKKPIISKQLMINY